MKKHIHLPITKEEAAALTAGESVLLSGIIYTARDAAHKRLIELIESNSPLPFDLNNAAIYYVGPSPAFDKHVIGSAGPTTSSRCDKYTPALLTHGVTVLVGKGRRNDDVKKELVRQSAVYLAATGGAGAMVSRCIHSGRVIAFEELGTEAVRELYIENFPAVVINDAHGNDYYDTARQMYLDSVNK